MIHYNFLFVKSDHQKTKVKFIEGYSQPKDTKALLETHSIKFPVSLTKNTQEVSALRSFQFYSGIF